MLPSRHRTTVGLEVGIVSALAAAGIVACSPPASPGIAAAASDALFVPLSPEARGSVANKRGQALWHDQQRLRMPCATADNCPTKLGPLATIYATPVLDRMSVPDSFNTEREVAWIEVTGVPDAGMDPPLAQGAARLLLQHLPATDTWRGRLVQGTEITPLSVYRYDYLTVRTPSATQWDWDEVNHRQLLGVQCGHFAWCVLGTSATITPLRPPECPAGAIDAGLQCGPCPGANGVADTSSAATKKCAIKGWYDQQRLALPKGTDGSVMLSDVTGVIVPVRGLGQMDDANLLAREPVVAGAWVTGDYTAKGISYKAGKLYKFTIDLDNASEARASWTFRGQAGRYTLDGVEDQNWLKRIFLGPPGPKVRWLRRDHHLPGEPVPGTVRWNWRDVDEGVWVRCGGGCCEDIWGA